MKKYLIFIVGIIIGVAGTSYAAYKLKAEQVSFDKSNTDLNSNDVQSAIDELVDELNDGKQLLAESITNKGVSTSDTDSFETMANNINNIKMGIPKNISSESISSKYFSCTAKKSSPCNLSHTFTFTSTKNYLFIYLNYSGDGSTHTKITSSSNVSAIINNTNLSSGGSTMLSGVNKGETISIQVYWGHSTSESSATRTGTVSLVGYYNADNY